MKTFRVAGRGMGSVAAALATSSLFLAGCSSSMHQADGLGGVVSPMAKVSGRIHGGNQPVSGATVTLYAAGQGAPGSASQALAHTTSASDGFGSFSFVPGGSGNSNSDNTYNCSLLSGNPVLYLVATGGTTVNSANAQPNPDAEFIAPLGRCADVSAQTFVNMSEVVTVATMAAMHQFMNPAGTGGIAANVGADGIQVAQLGIGNALYGVGNLVDLTTGYGRASLVKNGASNGSGGVSVTLTPELAKLNQLANAISACINASGTNPICAQLFQAAAKPADQTTTSVPNSAPTNATDILSALYNIFTNPTNSNSTNMAVIYGLSAGAGAPYQPTLGAMPSDWSIGVSYASSSSCSDVANSNSSFLSSPSSMDVDFNGNLWIANNKTNGGSLSSLTAYGQPQSCTTEAPTGGVGSGSQATAIDSSGNVWSGLGSTGDLFKYVPSTGQVTHLNINAAPLAMAADGQGNLFFSTVNGELYEIVGAATGGTTLTLLSSAISGNGTATSMIVDAASRVLVSGSSSVSVSYLGTGNGYNTATVSSNGSQGVTAGAQQSNGSTVYVGVNNSTAAVQYASITSGSGGVPVPGATNTATGGGLNTPLAVAIDGAQNVWVGNGAGSVVSAFSAGGTPLAANGFAKSASYLSRGRAITIDASGNVWVANSDTGVITEIVGAAVPVVKSYAYALSASPIRFQQIP